MYTNKVNVYRKSKAERDLDQQLFTKIGDKDSEKILPSKFKFLFQGPKRDLSSGLPEDYPYNWYLGGIFLNYIFSHVALSDKTHYLLGQSILQFHSVHT